MTHAKTPRGGAPVGHVAELDQIEAGAVHYLRLWCEGPDQQVRVHQDFAQALGADQGQAITQTFAELCNICFRHTRRPMMRRALGCKCLGADEAWFATFIGYASEGAREDAFVLAATMVRPDIAGPLVSLAQDFGGALRRMTHASHRPPERAPPHYRTPKMLQ